jgi:hypothetical protein
MKWNLSRRKKEPFFGVVLVPFLVLMLTHNACVMAQSENNLVRNGGFEQLADTLIPHPCPTSPSQIFKSLFWKTAFGSVDYFNSCSNDSYPNWGVPHNLYGNQVDKSSQSSSGAYAAFACYSNTMNNAREYLTTELAQPLVANRVYRLSFYVSLADNCNFAVGNIGACFTSSNIDWLLPATQYFDLVPKVEYDSAPITDTEGWTLVSGEFVAEGDEKFLTIGNFKSDMETNLEQVAPSEYEWDVSAYYIDDVSLEDLGEVGIEESPLTKFKLFPNPVNKDGWFTVDHDLTSGSVEFVMFNLMGIEVKRVSLPFRSTQIDLGKHGLSCGAYSYQLMVEGNSVGSGKIFIQ